MAIPLLLLVGGAEAAHACFEGGGSQILGVRILIVATGLGSNLDEIATPDRR